MLERGLLGMEHGGTGNLSLHTTEGTWRKTARWLRVDQSEVGPTWPDFGESWTAFDHSLGRQSTKVAPLPSEGPAPSGGAKIRPQPKDTPKIRSPRKTPPPPPPSARNSFYPGCVKTYDYYAKPWISFEVFPTHSLLFLFSFKTRLPEIRCVKSFCGRGLSTFFMN